MSKRAQNGVAAFWCLVVAFHVWACAGAKPCPVLVQADYTKALVEACADAGSVERCPAAKAITAAHELEQQDAGCRVKP